MAQINLDQQLRGKTDDELRTVLAGGDTFTDEAKQVSATVLNERSRTPSLAEAPRTDLADDPGDDSATVPPAPWGYALTQLAVGGVWLYRYTHASVLDIQEHVLIATVVMLSIWAAVSLRTRRLTGLVPIAALLAVHVMVWKASGPPWQLEPWIGFDRGGLLLVRTVPSTAILEGVLASLLVYLVRAPRPREA